MAQPAAGSLGANYQSVLKLPRTTRIAIVLLFLACVLNFLDRSIVNILAESISKELHLNDTQIGLMTGLAFTLLYSIIGLPMARFVDRPTTNRAGLMAGCLAAWSGMTAVCGLAASYPQMLVARVGVGIGEAGCTPGAHSLISDLVPPEKRSSALAFFGLGVPVGGLVGMMMGGVLADTVGWRNAFLIAGLPGLFVAVLIWFLVRDPRKSAQGVNSSPTDLRDAMAPGETLSSWAALREIMQSRAYVWLLIGGGALAFVNYGRGTWSLIYFMRDFGLSATQVGFFFGLSGGISGLLGTLLGGFIADRFGRRNPRHYLTGPALGYLVAVPLFIVAYSMQTWWAALLFLFIPGILDSTSYGPSFAAIQGVSRPATRGTAVAVKILIQALIGGGLGPLCLGMVSDSLKGQQGGESLRIVLQGASFGLLVVAFAYWRASLHLKSELRHLRP